MIQPQDDAHTLPLDPLNRGYLVFVYLLYVAGGLMTLVPSLTFQAAVIMLAGIFLIWLKKRSRNAILATHCLWLRRTFWIGMGVYLSVITLAIVTIAMPSVDTDALTNGMLDGTVSTPEQINALLMAQQPRQNLVLMVVLGALFAAWWLWRCGHGLWCLRQNRAIPHPKSWA